MVPNLIILGIEGRCDIDVMEDMGRIRVNESRCKTPYFPKTKKIVAKILVSRGVR